MHCSVITVIIMPFLLQYITTDVESLSYFQNNYVLFYDKKETMQNYIVSFLINFYTNLLICFSPQYLAAINKKYNSQNYHRNNDDILQNICK